MEHFKDNSGCSGPKKSEIFWNNSRKVQYLFTGALMEMSRIFIICSVISFNFIVGRVNKSQRYKRHRAIPFGNSVKIIQIKKSYFNDR